MKELEMKIFGMLCKLKEDLMDFVKREDAIGVVEVILILVVLIGLVIIFRDQLTSLVDSIFKTINEDAGSV